MEGDAVGNLVERSIFARYLDCNLVDVTAFDLLCTQQRRCDGKDTASAADIQHRVFRCDVLFQQLHAQSGGIVGSGTKRHTRIEGQHDVALLRLILLPGRADHQMLAHPYRMVILFPCVGPVFFIDIVQFQL